MSHRLRAFGLGLLSWFIPFAISFALFPLKAVNPTLFSTLMGLVVLTTAGILLSTYFRDCNVSAREAGYLGLLWLAMNLVLDYPMFAFGPMTMTIGHYYSEIGVAYLTFPIFAVLAVRFGQRGTN
jgi:hypothetical protein